MELREISYAVGGHEEQTATVEPAPNFAEFLPYSSAAAVPGDSSWNYRQVSQMLWVIGGPIIFFVGLCGNALIVGVMTLRRMQGSSTSVYLTLMAIADSMVLLTGIIPEWLEAAKMIVLKEWHQVACKLEKFLFYTSADSAVWFLVIFTIDRFIAVCYPLKKNNFCRSSRAKLSCGIVFAAAVLKNVHVLATRGAQYRTSPNQTASLISNCGKPDSTCEYFEDFVRPWIAFVIVCALPFFIILLCNIFIVRALLNVRRLRLEHAITSTSDKSLIQMTAMCLSASFCFLICVTPSIILLIGKPYWKRSNEAAYEMAKVVNNELVFVNHSINFFLYCITGRRFRSGIASLCRCNRRQSIDTTMTDASIESRVTLGKLDPSPETGKRRLLEEHHHGSLGNGCVARGRSVSMGMTKAALKKSSSDVSSTDAATLPRFRSPEFRESAM